MILDLRFNPGGLVRSAVDTCGLFVPPKTMVVYTEGRDPAQDQQYYTGVIDHSRGSYPVAVLVNSETASAAEIVAGALKDLKRAILVGETTFGKGVVQSEVPLPDGSAIRLDYRALFYSGQANHSGARHFARHLLRRNAGTGACAHRPAPARLHEQCREEQRGTDGRRPIGESS